MDVFPPVTVYTWNVYAVPGSKPEISVEVTLPPSIGLLPICVSSTYHATLYPLAPAATAHVSAVVVAGVAYADEFDFARQLAVGAAV